MCRREARHYSAHIVCVRAQPDTTPSRACLGDSSELRLRGLQRGMN